MKLRQRIIIVCTCCLIAAGLAISDVVLKSSARGFSEIERDRAEVDSTRIHEALLSKVESLHSKSADWSNWDDTYEFIADSNREYVQSNLTVDSLRSINVDLILILDRKGNHLESIGVPDEKGIEPNKTWIQSELKEGNLLDPANSTSGLIQVGNETLLISIRPVFPTSGLPPSRGYIIFARRLDAGLQSELRRVTRQPVHFATLSEDERSKYEASPSIADAANPTVQEIDQDELIGTTIARDLLGKPVLALETVYPRKVLAYGKQVGQSASARLIGIALLFALVMILMIERLVLRRVRSLHHQIAAVGSDVDGTRIRLEGRDELALLATQVNTMLARIETGSSALKASEERLRQHNENLEHLVNERTREIEEGAKALRESEERLRLHNENLERLVEARTREIEHQALHDKLTGLPNRALFLDRLGHTLAQSRRSSRESAVLFIDLDNFKLINDSLGHDKGDILLMTIAERISASVRNGDTVARLGGDEFTAILDGVDDAEEALRVAERILGALKQPIMLGSIETFANASIGLALCSSGETANDVLKHADTAMYRAKAAGKAACVIFDPRMNEHAVERLALETAFRKALQLGEIKPVFQPIVDLQTNKVVGSEALARWTHPERGPISPEQFIPIAEDTGLIVPMGYAILEKACAQAKEWIDARPGQPFTLNVNVSGRQLRGDDIVARVEDVLKRTGLPADCLKLEITESVLLSEGDGAVDRLKALKALGIKLALDDFGTGYSSLSTLRDFPIDTLKIDRAFIRVLGEDESAIAIVEAIAAMARTMKMDVTAEGVETREHESIIRELGVKYGQGYHYAKPMAAAEFVAQVWGPAQDDTLKAAA